MVEQLSCNQQVVGSNPIGGSNFKRKAGERVELSNLKHERFCQEYAKTANAAQSYKKVYNAKSSNQVLAQSASRLLKKENIRARLREINAEIHSSKIMEVAEMQEVLSEIARMQKLEDVVVVEGVDKGVSEAKIVQKKNSANDAIKAIIQLAKMQGVAENINVNVSVPIIAGEDQLEE